MIGTHKHKGVERSDTGALRSHPTSQKHKDKYAQRCHTLEINRRKKDVENQLDKKYPAKVAKVKANARVKKALNRASSKVVDFNKLPEPEVKEVKPKINVQEDDKGKINFLIDDEGYISLHLDSTNTKGVRVTFSRKEGNTKRICGLQIENKPTTPFKRKKILTKNSVYY